MAQDPIPPDDHLRRYRVTAPDADALRSFIAESGADVSCRPVAVRTDRGLVAQVLLAGARLDTPRTGGVQVEEVEDVTATQQAARADVPPGDRFASRGAVPRGLGRKE